MPIKNLQENNKGKGKFQIKNRAESLALAISRAPQSITVTTHNVADIFAADIGRDEFITALRLSSKVSKITEILMVYDKLTPSEKAAVSFDSLCQQVDYPSEKLVGEATSARLIRRNRIVQSILIEEAPAVLRAGMKQAATPLGVEDRRMAYQLLGYMPFDKGNEVNIQNIVNPKGTPKFEDAPDAAPSFMADVIDGDTD